MNTSLQRIKVWLGKLDFRTGVIVLICCAVCYIISFAQMALPISVGTKGMLWVLFFGLAKACQYAGILILGKEGVRRIKQHFKRKRN